MKEYHLKSSRICMRLLKMTYTTKTESVICAMILVMMAMNSGILIRYSTEEIAKAAIMKNKVEVTI